jgi:hypothetical protein
MCRLLLILHHNALCTPYIALVNCGHLLYMRVDHVKSESEFQAEQEVQWVFGGPQALSCEYTNLALD